jgi:hypothetical protein
LERRDTMTDVYTIHARCTGISTGDAQESGRTAGGEHVYPQDTARIQFTTPSGKFGIRVPWEDARTFRFGATYTIDIVEQVGELSHDV